MNRSNRHCAFCGGANLTKEHGWPRWIDKYTPDAINVSTQIESSHHQPIEREWRKQVSGNEARFFCQSCNNGWMSELENAASAIIGPMIRGRGTLLAPEHQATIGAWLVKMSLARMYTIPTRFESAYEQVFRRFYEARRPLEGHQVLIGAYKVDGQMVFCGHSYHSPTNVSQPTGYSCIIGVGHFVGHIHYSPYRYDVQTDEYWRPIFPHPGAEFIWPPGPFVAYKTLRKNIETIGGPPV